MKRLTFVVVLTAILGSGACASVRSDIQRQYTRWARAALSNDVDAILSILAPDYSLHTYTGTTINRTDYEASLRKRKAANKPATAYETKINNVTVEGSTALVISDETSEAVSLDPVTNKKVKLIHIHRYLDTWIRSGKGWRLRTTITKVESTTVAPA